MPFPMGPQVFEVNLAGPITRAVVTTECRNTRNSLKFDWLVLAEAVPIGLLITVHDTKEKTTEAKFVLLLLAFR